MHVNKEAASLNTVHGVYAVYSDMQCTATCAVLSIGALPLKGKGASAGAAAWISRQPVAVMALQERQDSRWLKLAQQPHKLLAHCWLC